MDETSKMNKEKIVNDAIFGIITLKPHIVAIIDTLEFQRLRNIWQLGVASFVYPTADHSRFEHSIGTYWLASRIVTKLQKQLQDEKAEIEITDKDVMCVEIAALCHDIGHGPFSHVWDKKVLPEYVGASYKEHEKQFGEMWTILKGNSKVEEIVRNNELEKSSIENLINGEGEDILKDIISNKDCGMDVDKWDYLARDSTYLGHSSTNYRIDIDRMIHYVRAIKDDKDGTWKVAFRDTEGLNMFRVFHLRHYMHQTAYKHRTVIAIEGMFVDGIGQCIEDGILKLEEIGTPTWILENTDAIFWSNYHRINSFKRILERDLYRQIFEAVKYKNMSKEDTKKVKNDCLEIIRDEETKIQGAEKLNLYVTDCGFKFGNEDGNPMLKIPFYNKHKDEKIFRYTKETLPSNLDLNCDETRIMVFSKNKVENNDSRIISIKKRLETYFVNKEWRIQNIK